MCHFPQNVRRQKKLLHRQKLAHCNYEINFPFLHQKTLYLLRVGRDVKDIQANLICDACTTQLINPLLEKNPPILPLWGCCAIMHSIPFICAGKHGKQVSWYNQSWQKSSLRLIC